MTIEDKVRRAVKECGLTSTQIEDASGVSAVNVRQFRTGSRNLPLKSLQKLADAVGLEIVVQTKKKSRKSA